MTDEKLKGNTSDAASPGSPFLEMATGESLASIRKDHQKAIRRRRRNLFIIVIFAVSVYFAKQLMKIADELQSPEHQEQISREVEKHSSPTFDTKSP
jgi:hypothetical protein